MNIYNKHIRSCLKRKHELLSLFEAKPKDINPWAFIRAYNEIETIHLTLRTMLEGGIKRGVLGYHLDENGKDDGTSEVIKQFCKENPNFIAVEYPYVVVPYDHHLRKNIENDNQLLSSYYNFVFDKIPVNDWFIKIDCDHLYNQVALKELLKQPKRALDSIYLPAINMHYADNELYFLNFEYRENYFMSSWYKNGRDHQLQKKHKHIHYYMAGACEEIYSLNKWKKAENIISLHFPLMKKSRIHLATKENLIPYDDFDFSQLPMTEIDKDFLLNKEKILSYFKNKHN